MIATLAHAAFRCVLLLCPKAFRDEYGAEIEADFRDQRSTRSRARATANLAGTGLGLRCESVGRDVAFAMRAFAKAPGFVAVSIAAVAFAIAVNVTIGSVTEHFFLNPLPYPNSGRLVAIYQMHRGIRSESMSYPDVADIAVRNHTFAALAGEMGVDGTLTGRGSPIALHGGAIGGRYFAVLGVHPELGRLLDATDTGKATIVISDELWRKRFAGDPNVLGQIVAIGDREQEIVGVAPPRTFVPSLNGMLERIDFWRYVDPRRDPIEQRGFSIFAAIARLRPGVTVETANADLQRRARDLADRYSHTNRGRGFLAVPLAEAMLGTVTPLLLVLHAAALVVFAIAASNLAGLFLVRAAARVPELRLRYALGATRSRVMAQLAVEASSLVAAGSVVGVLLGWLALAWLRSTIAQLIPSYWEAPGVAHLGIDAALLAYVVALAALFTLGCALVPAYTTRQRLVTPGLHRSTAAQPVRRLLTTAQMTLAFVLVVMAALLVRSFFALEHADVGFDGTNLYWVSLPTLPPDRYPSYPLERAFAQRFAERMQATPGILSVSGAMEPFFMSENKTLYRLPRQGAFPDSQLVDLNAVSPGYFRTLRIPLLRGREFSDRDRSTSQPVAIVSESFAIDVLGTRNAAGRFIAISMDANIRRFPLRRIVGVVGNVRDRLARPPAQAIYVPQVQLQVLNGFAVRVKHSTPQLANALTREARAIDPLLPPVQVTSFAEWRSLDAMPNRFAAIILTTVALIALALALSGVYGVIAYAVEQRTREFGVRMALGAPSGRVLSAVLRETAFLAAIALLIGLLLSAFCTRALAGYLVGTSPVDVATFAAVAVLMLACSLLACLAPARKAMSIAPAEALRYE